MVRAAVTMILRPSPSNTDEIEVLMMRRAERKGDPWSGQMAFPGGKMDSKDESSFVTSLRELAEETGIPEPDRVLKGIGRLSDVITRSHNGKRPMVVTPFAFELTEDVSFSPNHEVAELLWIPLSYICDRGNRERITWKYNGHDIHLPCYYYDGKQIWGLSLTMLDEMVRLLYGKRFKDTHSRLQFSPRPNWLLRTLGRWR